MATIYNSDLTKGLQKNAKIQINVDSVPNKLAEKVVPTMETNPQLLRVCNIVRSGTAVNTTATIYSTPTNKDFYLTSIELAHDSGAGSGIVWITVTIDGAAQIISRVPVPAAAGLAVSNNGGVFPIKIDRGTNITITSDTAGVDAYGVIVGYTIDD